MIQELNPPSEWLKLQELERRWSLIIDQLDLETNAVQSYRGWAFSNAHSIPDLKLRSETFCSIDDRVHKTYDVIDSTRDEWYQAYCNVRDSLDRDVILDYASKIRPAVVASDKKRHKEKLEKQRIQRAQKAQKGKKQDKK